MLKQVTSMKKLFVYLMLLSFTTVKSQNFKFYTLKDSTKVEKPKVLNGDKIDYNNFDQNLATKALAKAFLNFRDTIDCFQSGEKWETSYPETKLFPELTKPRWSDWVYQNISLHNTKEMIKNPYNKAYHVDREKWYLSNKDLVRKEYYKGIKNVPTNYVEGSFLTYSENTVCYGGQMETYQDLANLIIKTWDESISHSCALRGSTHDVFGYSFYGLKIQDMFACCVMYNPNTKLTKASINFIE